MLSNTLWSGKLKDVDNNDVLGIGTVTWEVTTVEVELTIGPMCEIGAGIACEGGANVEGAVVIGTLWEVMTVEVIGTGTQVQVLPLAEVEAPHLGAAELL